MGATNMKGIFNHILNQWVTLYNIYAHFLIVQSELQ